MFHEINKKARNPVLFLVYLFVSFLLDLIPNAAYIGQKLIKLVKINTPATTSNTIPNVPEMTSNMYKTAITAASNKRSILSRVPTFFFIIFKLSCFDSLR